MFGPRVRLSGSWGGGDFQTPTAPFPRCRAGRVSPLRRSPSIPFSGGISSALDASFLFRPPILGAAPRERPSPISRSTAERSGRLALSLACSDATGRDRRGWRLLAQQAGRDSRCMRVGAGEGGKGRVAAIADSFATPLVGVAAADSLVQGAGRAFRTCRRRAAEGLSAGA